MSTTITFDVRGAPSLEVGEARLCVARLYELDGVASDAAKVLIKAQHNNQSKWLGRWARDWVPGARTPEQLRRASEGAKWKSMKTFSFRARAGDDATAVPAFVGGRVALVARRTCCRCFCAPVCASVCASVCACARVCLHLCDNAGLSGCQRPHCVVCVCISQRTICCARWSGELLWRVVVPPVSQTSSTCTSSCRTSTVVVQHPHRQTAPSPTCRSCPSVVRVTAAQT
jgi:hypothetical protein